MYVSHHMVEVILIINWHSCTKQPPTCIHYLITTLQLSLLLFAFCIVNYTQQLYEFVGEWRKNPQWSVSCCLAFVLPLFSLPGEIGSLSSTNVLHAQLDSGQMGMSTIADAVNEGGVTDITLDKNDGDGFEQKDDPPEQIQNIKERNDQSVQTAIRTPT